MEPSIISLFKKVCQKLEKLEEKVDLVLDVLTEEGSDHSCQDSASEIENS